MEEPKLKPCPFCGGEAKASNVLMCVYCVNCGIATECYSDNSISIKKWNTRVEPDRYKKMVEITNMETTCPKCGDELTYYDAEGYCHKCKQPR